MLNLKMLNLKVVALFMGGFILLLLPVKASSQVSTPTAYFVDSCSGNPTYVKTENGTELKLELTNLIPDAVITVLIEYFPSGLSSEEISKYRQTERFTFTTDEYGRLATSLALPPDEKLDSVEAKLPGYNIWNASITWFQTDENNKTFSASTYASIYRMKSNEPFFQITSDVQCFWETEPTVSSEYYFNDFDTEMKIHRQSILTSGHTGFKGFNFGNNPMVAGELFTVPLGQPNPYLPGMGWFFKNWDTQQSLQQNIEITRYWNLSRDSGGFFFDRISFNRMKADRYEWVDRPEKACGSFEKTASGVLDLGSRSSEFYSVPIEDAADPDRILAFVDQFRPTQNTCEDLDQSTDPNSEFLISSHDGNMMFYYPSAAN